MFQFYQVRFKLLEQYIENGSLKRFQFYQVRFKRDTPINSMYALIRFNSIKYDLNKADADLCRDLAEVSILSSTI